MTAPKVGPVVVERERARRQVLLRWRAARVDRLVPYSYRALDAGKVLLRPRAAHALGVDSGAVEGGEPRSPYRHGLPGLDPGRRPTIHEFVCRLDGI